MDDTFPSHGARGFTLVELAIALVIIGLLVGGVMVGRDLIAAATTQSQIKQIEKYRLAANAFLLKYGYLPGDIKAGAAAQFGFAARGANCGQGDGDGIIMGNRSGASWGCYSIIESAGETVLFWVDLSAAKMIEENFTTATAINSQTDVSSTDIPLWLPAAKAGGSNRVAVFSNNFNYFLIEKVTGITASPNVGWLQHPSTSIGLPVAMALAIDTKLDDGVPVTGQVLATYVDSGTALMNNGANWQTAGITETSIYCLGNSGVAGVVPHYAISFNSGNNENCPLAIRF